MDRAAILAQPALSPPDGVVPNFENPPNMNTLANGVLIAGIILASFSILFRLHSWVFVLTSLRGRLEGGKSDTLALSLLIFSSKKIRKHADQNEKSS